MLLAADRSQLLIVDVQDRLLPAMADPGAVLRQCIILARAAAELGVPATASAQYPKGLGPVVADLRELVGDDAILDKLAFSCARDPGLRARLEAGRERGRDQVVVAGIEAHVCVLQTCLELAERGFKVACAIDATGSRQPGSVEVAAARLQAAGVLIITVEMAVFEWLGVAGTEKFKRVSALIR